MKTKCPSAWLTLLTLWLLVPALASRAADRIETRIHPHTNGAELIIQSSFALPVAAQVPEFTLLHSTNLTTWAPAAPPFTGEFGVSEGELRLSVPSPHAFGFYHVVGQVKHAPLNQSLGPAIFGYAAEFARQRRLLGQLELDAFRSAYGPTNPYLTTLSFNPTNAEYWTNFGASGFQLDTNELARFQTNAFVVSQRLGRQSFARSYYSIFTADLPVFISCDAMLQAWHRSYLGMLEELEESLLGPRLQTILDSMAAQVGPLYGQSLSTALADGVRDADFFLAVARSLRSGTNYYGYFNQSAAVLATLNAITNLQPLEISLFGTPRTVDFSQFRVRGHYTTSQALGRYFRASMWCALADFRFAGETSQNALRELSGTVALHFLLKNSGQFQNWKQVDDVIQMFVGVPDSLNFQQLSNVLAGASITAPASLPNLAALQNLHARLMSGEVGVQHVQSGYFWSPLSAAQLKLPRSFTFLGQRFTPDSWAFNQVVFDRIIWDADGLPGLDDKVLRRVPSALDIAFSVLGNRHVTPLIADRIADPNGHPWRDGKPYQHNLAAVANTFDLQNQTAWTNNIYSTWLWCLRALSEPLTGPEYPDALRTREWAMKTLNTQLASWSQLRHDTILYAQQSYTPPLLCSYPDGFVEPRLAFWDRMRVLAQRTRALVATLPTAGTFIFEPNVPGGDPWYNVPITNTLANMSANRLGHLDGFAARMLDLKTIATKQLARQPLTSNEVFLIQSLIDDPTTYAVIQYSGWYPGLYYANSRAANSTGLSISDRWDALVADVHTDLPDEIVGDPGSILHQAVGNADLLLISVNWGPGDACVYTGPVLSHYEFELGPTVRLTDEAWKNQLGAGQAPPPPPWTRGYLVPGTATNP